MWLFSKAQLPSLLFSMKLEYRIRVLAGDKVQVEMNTYDLTKGRINYRFK